MTATDNALAIAVADPLPLARQVFGNDERIAVLKEQLGRGWKEPMTDAELGHIALVCQRTRLDALAKPAQIYFIKRWDSRLRKEVMTPQVSIDGLRLIAQRSRAYAGATAYLYTGDGKDWTEVWLSLDPPAAAKVGVKKRGGEWFWAVATWAEWKQEVDEYDSKGNKTGGKKLAPFWEAKPAHMLGKTAEAIALKRAFPEETNDLELAAADQDYRAEQAALAQRYTEIMGTEEDAYHLGAMPALASPAASPPAEQSGREADQPPASRRPGPRTYDEAFAEDDHTLIEHDGRVVDAATGEVLDEPPKDRPPIAGWQRNRQLVAEANKRKLTGVPALNTRSPLDVVEAANEELAQRIRNYDLDQHLVKEQEAHF